MPTPLAHGVAGFAVVRSVRSSWRTWRLMAAAFLITLLPDLDFVPGLLVGDAGMYHRGATHSLAGAVLFSLPIAAGLVWLGSGLLGRGQDSERPGLWKWYGFVLPVYGSHVLLDLFSTDTIQNSGQRLWWPFSNTYVRLPVPMPTGWREFFDLQFGPGSDHFFGTLFSTHGLAVYVAEAFLFSPILLLPVLVGRIRRGRQRRAARLAGRDGGQPLSRGMAAAGERSS